MKKVICILILLLQSIWATTPSYSIEKSSTDIPASAIRRGCSISFSKEYQPNPEDPLSNPPFSLIATWSCRDGERLPIDRYEINGSSPEIVTVLYWDRRDIVVLVKWPVSSAASDYSGDYYEVFAYQYEKGRDSSRFVIDRSVTDHFPAGFDGSTKDGNPVVYPFKEAASIRARLRAIHLH